MSPDSLRCKLWPKKYWIWLFTSTSKLLSSRQKRKDTASLGSAGQRVRRPDVGSIVAQLVGLAVLQHGAVRGLGRLEQANGSGDGRVAPLKFSRVEKYSQHERTMSGPWWWRRCSEVSIFNFLENVKVLI